jgi:hypothetical protein
MKKNNSTNFSNYRHLPFNTIKAATRGDIQAMNTVNQHFGGYIAKLSIRPMRDADGNERYAVDESIRRELEAKLAAAVMKFRVV